MYNVLFICTGNSKRSIMAEALLNHWGKGRFKAYSAGSHPKDAINSNAIEVIKTANLPLPNVLKPKSWNEFGTENAPKMDFVITVCDKAKGERCPVWPGQPVNAHWGVEDPTAKDGDLAEYREVLRILSARVQLFVQLPLKTLDSVKLQQQLDDIGIQR